MPYLDSGHSRLRSSGNFPRLPSLLHEGLGFNGLLRVWGLGWVLPPLSNSWIISIVCLYIALNRTPNIDCYWGGAVPNGLGLRETAPLLPRGPGIN